MGEETAISDRRLPNRRRARVRAVSLGAFATLAIGLSACGGGDRQDASEPSGNFPVAVKAAKFPTDQRLAQTSNLQLEVQNTGQKQVPNLAVTIYTGDHESAGSFSVRTDQPGLADPNRPVWILESGFPKVLEPGESKKQLESAPTAGADAAQTNTFAFGPLDPGDSKTMVWRLTPVEAGTYTIHYELAAGLNGNAKAVGEDNHPVSGEFVVTITDKPPKATVNGSGQVELQNR